MPSPSTPPHPKRKPVGARTDSEVLREDPRNARVDPEDTRTRFIIPSPSTPPHPKRKPVGARTGSEVIRGSLRNARTVSEDTRTKFIIPSPSNLTHPKRKPMGIRDTQIDSEVKSKRLSSSSKSGYSLRSILLERSEKALASTPPPLSSLILKKKEKEKEREREREKEKDKKKNKKSKSEKVTLGMLALEKFNDKREKSE